jgi:hypothetical protein
MPDPLMGLYPSELSPLTQPYAVSDAAPLMTFGTHRETTPSPASARAETRAPTEETDTPLSRTCDLNRSPRITAQRHACLPAARRSTRHEDRRGHVLSRGRRSASRPNAPYRTDPRRRNAVGQQHHRELPASEPSALRRQPLPPTAQAACFRAQRPKTPAPSTDRR